MPERETADAPGNPYLLLTPGPLSTTASVKRAMLRDWCTWDDEYHRLVQSIRARLVALGNATESHTAVLMQGSGTFSVEATLTSAVPRTGKLLVLANGAYGQRMAVIARRAEIPCEVIDFGELAPADPERLERALAEDPAISHVAVVHCETTTGMLNPVETIGTVVTQAGRIFIVDAMSSFGGMPIDLNRFGADFLISSANKCIQGVPGFGFVLARKELMPQLQGRSRSLSLDLHDQWRTMEQDGGKWRFTSPTHVVRAFARALDELAEEGGIGRRHARYLENHRVLVERMTDLGFSCLLESAHRSPIITAFHNPAHPDYVFKSFYDRLKAQGFVIYPGKVTDHDTFRIGTIGDVHPHDMKRLTAAVNSAMYWRHSP